MRIAVIAALVLASSPAFANCNAIRDYEVRSACFARERQSPETCISIRDSDRRELCRQDAGQKDIFGRTQARGWRQ